MVLGLVVGIVQVFFWFQDRRTRRAQLRLLEIVGNQLDAERARAEAKQSATLVEQLRAQIDRDLPAEARRVYLSQRLDSLARSITSDFEEYVQIEREMAPSSSVSPLHQQVRTVVEQTILPTRQRERQRERITLVMLGLLLAIALLPYDVGGLLVAHFAELAEPDYYYDSLNYDSLYTAILVGVITWSVTTLVVGNFFRWSYNGRLQRTKTVRLLSLQHIRAGQIALMVAVAMVIGGIIVAAKAIQITTIGTGIDAYIDYNVQESGRMLAGVLLSFGVPLFGVSLARVIAGAWIPWPGGFRGRSGRVRKAVMRIRDPRPS
ncbi:hypothetical protein [Micromonospora chersina]|uniref:hypothetical protein n=1 Tax=Micromonospora chersina TaxID=47854 RepID=UPI003718A48F